MSGDQPGRRKDLRPSNAEREPYEQALAQAVAEGRLDQQTFEDRLTDVARASNFAALEESVADVPFTLHTKRATTARNTTRRNFVLGLAGLGIIGGAAAWATRQLPDPAATGPSGHTPIPSAPGETDGSGSIATSMVQVPMMTAEMFPMLVEHLESIDVTRVADIHAWDVYITVDGVRRGKNVNVSYQTDQEPEVAKGGDQDGTFAVKKLRHTDVADLLKRSAKIIKVGDEPTIFVRNYDDNWVIDVTGVDSAVVQWDLSGEHRYQP